jgi:hypothetical protein
MQVIFSLQDINRSESGDKIFFEKVLKRLAKKNPKLLDEILSRMEKVIVDLGNGEQESYRFSAPTERMSNFIIRLTKGFLVHFYPEYDFSADEFRTRFFKFNEESNSEWQELVAATKFDNRGDEVFEFRHGTTENKTGGIWFYVFYSTLGCSVLHFKPSDFK